MRLLIQAMRAVRAGCRSTGVISVLSIEEAKRYFQL